MPAPSIILGLLLVLGSAFIGGFIAKKLKQPLLVGYLAAGIIGSGIMTRFGIQRESLGTVAEIGFSLLMFTLGLEFSLQRIGKLKKLIITGSVLQMILTICVGFLILNFGFKYDIKFSFIAAAAFSLSSTAIVVKILSEKNQLESLSGEIMVGWLLLQDLAVLPILSILPVLFGSSFLLFNLLTILKALTILAITWISAQIIVPKIVEVIVVEKSRELLIIFVVTAVLVLAGLSASFGFSLGLGAFLAGLILSKTESHFAIFSEIRPLRDVFLAIFFISLGLSLEPAFIIGNIGKIILLSLIFLLVKIIISGVILGASHYHAKTIIYSSFGLGEVSEFAFILAATSLSARYISSGNYSLIVSVALLSMVATPALFSLSEKSYSFLSKRVDKSSLIYKKYFGNGDKNIILEDNPIEGHAIILGFGRVGKWVGSILDEAEIPYLVVEYDPRIVRDLKREGKKVVFGDPTDLAVLNFAQIGKAKLIIIALPDILTQKMVIANCKTANPKIKIICRSHAEEENELKSLGVESIIHPEFEAALSISHRTLQIFNFGKEEINERLKRVKKEYEQ